MATPTVDSTVNTPTATPSKPPPNAATALASPAPAIASPSPNAAATETNAAANDTTTTSTATSNTATSNTTTKANTTTTTTTATTSSKKSKSKATPTKTTNSTTNGTNSSTGATPTSSSKSSGGSGRGSGGRGGGRGGRGGRGGGRGGRGGRGSSSSNKNAPIAPAAVKSEKEKDDVQRWFSGSVQLGLPEDKFWLSELQVYLRCNFAEAFGATEADIAAPMHGRNKPIALGQVGIRCKHCRNDPPTERGQQATSYPSLISGIYNSVQQMLRLHLDCCMSMPVDVRQKIEQLKMSSSARGGRKQYWVDSAKRLGLVDTPHGIHFGRDPYGPLPPAQGPLLSTKAGGTGKDKKKSTADGKGSPNKDSKTGDEEKEKPSLCLIPDYPVVDLYPLVVEGDKPLISDYLYLTLEQMQPCNLMEADKVGCYKGRKVGFPGLACKHCIGQAGCGRYFPASEASLSQTTTSQTIMNHVRNCRRCPVEIRESLELMKRAKMGPDGKRADKPKHGGRKVFFHRLWCRIQRLPLSDDEEEKKKKKGSGTWSRPKKPIPSKKSPSKKRPASSSLTDASQANGTGDNASNETSASHNHDEDGDSEETSEETETEDDGSSDEDDGDDDDSVPARGTLNGSGKNSGMKSLMSPSSGMKKKGNRYNWNEGCVRLTKTDDPHWLSEMHCYVRSELVEVFSLRKKDVLEGYSGRKEPVIGQVGVRCAFCKSLPKGEKPNGYLHFPESLSAIHTKVSDLIRLHFPSCPSMPDDVKSTFRSLRGFGAKADGDSQQYWIDAASDLGLCDIPPTGNVQKGWGITFRRDPLPPSPADELDREKEGAKAYQPDKSSLLRPDDTGQCTDHVLLLMRQVQPCRFKNNDRRGGPGSRGRDRVIGFPGLCCRHCSTKNTYGRYFPVSAKNLTDNTANSLLAHVTTCNRVPESIQASLAYLMHRSTLQKAELSGSWKKAFFKKIWDRLHVERAWSIDEGTGANGTAKDDDPLHRSVGSPRTSPMRGGSKSNGNNGDAKMGHGSGGMTTRSSNGGDLSGSDDEEVSDRMADLIKAAAIWLCEQEASTDSSSRTRPNKARALPTSKRALPFTAGRSRSRGDSPTSKRRRVHF